MSIEAKQFLTSSGRRVLTDDGRQGMDAVFLVDSSTEKSEPEFYSVSIYKDYERGIYETSYSYIPHAKHLISGRGEGIVCA